MFGRGATGMPLRSVVARMEQTAGLPALADEVKLTLAERADGSGGGGRIVFVVVVAHLIGLVLQVVGAFLAADKELHTDPANKGSLLLADGTVPGQLLLLEWQAVIFLALFAVLTVVDGVYFLQTSWIVSGCALAMGVAGVATSAALLGIAAFALDGIVYVVQLVSLLAVAVGFGCSVAISIETLVRSSSGLQQRIEAAL